jgi:multimeric flavodoxin WrbA
MKIKVLAINGSPNPKGNTWYLLNEALKTAKEIKDVETDYISLAEVKMIGGCTGCLICHKQPSLEKLCRGYKEPDDINMILRRMLDAEAWFVGTPVYFGGVTAQLKILMDRSHPGQPCGRAWRNKVVGISTMAAERAGGAEATIDDIKHWLSNLDALPVSIGPARPDPGAGSFWGAAGVQGWPYMKWGKEGMNAVKEDMMGLQAARNLARRVIELAKAIKAGFAALPKEEIIYGYGAYLSSPEDSKKYEAFKRDDIDFHSNK